MQISTIIDKNVPYFEKTLGAEYYKDVPSCVSVDIMNITCLSDVSAMNQRRYYTGSAEQGFLDVYPNLKPATFYMHCNTCYRPKDNGKSEYHSPKFNKLELFMKLPDIPYGQYNEIITLVVRNYVENYGLKEEYFARVNVSPPDKSGLCTTHLQYDLMYKDVELGSYGMRSYKGYRWLFGTLFTDFRVEKLMSQENQGYHLQPIERGTLGQFSKIKEEFLELEDAVKQKNLILQMVEMSDLLGAIEQYGKTLGLSLDDIIRMLRATERAFKNGHR